MDEVEVKTTADGTVNEVELPLMATSDSTVDKVGLPLMVAYLMKLMK